MGRVTRDGGHLRFTPWERGWATLAGRLLLALLALAGLRIPAGAGTPDAVATVVAAAREQIGRTVVYDGSYRKLAYPGGDIPMERGVCTDVIVRAFRRAGCDLQVLVHEDMARDFGSYPHAWGLTSPDANIDHRRVPNLVTFFRRHGQALPASHDGATYLPGDIVTWRLPSGVPHIGLVSTGMAPGGGRRMVIHNIGAGTQEEDVLFLCPVTGHYRYFR